MNSPNNNTPSQTAITLVSCTSSDTWKTEIQKVLPKEILIEAFLRVTRTVAGEQKFSRCEPKTFLSALLKCARAGLMPDGIHSHLIPFGQEVICIFDWKGVVDVASRNGIEVVPKVICANDDFSVQEDDGSGRTVVHHKWGMGDRGEIVGYYSRARKKDGSTDYEFMTLKEVESVRQNYSNAKNSKAWDKSFDEMGKKTVIKRHSKRWPISQEARATLHDDSDEDITDLPKIKTPVFDGPQYRALTSGPAPEPEKPMTQRKRPTMVEEPLESIPDPTLTPQPTAPPQTTEAVPVETPEPVGAKELRELNEQIVNLRNAADVTEEQLVMFMRAEKWMKDKHKGRSDVSSTHLRAFVAAWQSNTAAFVARIKSVNKVAT